jgi:formate hydrogenlyase subunit 3/multisubunit Na+/H+ antiporter MnhD subunit
MTSMLLVLTLAAPVMILTGAVARARSGTFLRLTWLAALPALVTALAGEATTVELPWMLLQGELRLDRTGRVFLGFSALIWLAVGVFANAYFPSRRALFRYVVFCLPAMLGNFGAIVAGDMATFLLFFIMLSLSVYGLVIHDRSRESLRAGRVYLIMAVLGEIVLFASIVIAAQQCGTISFAELGPRLASAPARDAIVWLMLIGLGIKLGAVPLHLWLPLAHPAAPTPASALLSGAVIKIGALGYLRFLPLGQATLPDAGGACIAVGLVAMLGGAIVGTLQSRPKVVLAYCSVSHMGLVMLGIGVGLMAPGRWPTIELALLLFVTHHALTKAVLFLGVGVSPAALGGGSARAVWAMLWILSLSLAGMPLTTGAAAKQAMKSVATMAPDTWLHVLPWLLSLSAVLTVVLMVRFLVLLQMAPHPPERPAPGRLVPWLGLTSLLLLGPLLLGAATTLPPTWNAWAIPAIWSGLWPVAVGLGLAWIARRLTCAAPENGARWVPAGDLVVPVEACSRIAARVGRSVVETARATRNVVARLHARRHPLIDAVESTARTLAVIDGETALKLSVGALLIVLFLMS